LSAPVRKRGDDGSGGHYGFDASTLSIVSEFHPLLG
jgi:hypothetical protein